MWGQAPLIHHRLHVTAACRWDTSKLTCKWQYRQIKSAVACLAPSCYRKLKGDAAVVPAAVSAAVPAQSTAGQQAVVHLQAVPDLLPEDPVANYRHKTGSSSLLPAGAG